MPGEPVRVCGGTGHMPVVVSRGGCIIDAQDWCQFGCGLARLCVRLCVRARAHTHEPTQTHERARARARGCLFWATCWFRCHDLHLHVHQGEICGARSRRGVETSSRAIRVAGIAESTYVGPPAGRHTCKDHSNTKEREGGASQRGKVVHHRTYFRFVHAILVMIEVEFRSIITTPE